MLNYQEKYNLWKQENRHMLKTAKEIVNDLPSFSDDYVNYIRVKEQLKERHKFIECIGKNGKIFSFRFFTS